jgi:hypothetical protein
MVHLGSLCHKKLFLFQLAILLALTLEFGGELLELS